MLLSNRGEKMNISCLLEEPVLGRGRDEHKSPRAEEAAADKCPANARLSVKQRGEGRCLCLGL